MALAEPLPVPASEPDDADLTAVLPLPAPEPGPFEGWVGVIVPADEPGFMSYGNRRGFRSPAATPGKILLLVPPNLLAALRNGQAT